LVEQIVESEGERYPDRGPDARFFERYSVLLAVENAQIERQHSQNEKRENTVKPPILGEGK
jgi:hypothetical protein